MRLDELKDILKGLFKVDVHNHFGNTYNITQSSFVQGDLDNSVKGASVGASTNLLDSRVSQCPSGGLAISEALDCREEVITREDIAPEQLYLAQPLSNPNVNVMRNIGPYLQCRSQDVGAMYASLRLVEIEDRADDKTLADSLRNHIHSAFPDRGSLIYNLMRSQILQCEIMAYLNRLKKLHGKNDLVTVNSFLKYWDGIMKRGYPDAHFVCYKDDQSTLAHQIALRFSDPTIKRVRIYSRTAARNKQAIKWCEAFAADRGFSVKVARRYTIGFSSAVRIEIRSP